MKYHVTTSSGRDFIMEHDGSEYDIAYEAYEEACIIREKNLSTGKIKEYVYQNAGAAKNKCRKIMDLQESEFTVVNADTIHHLTPKHLEDMYDDPLA